MIMPATKPDRRSKEEVRCGKELRSRLAGLGIGKPNRLSGEQARHSKELDERIAGLRVDQRLDWPAGPTRKPTEFTDELGERILDHMIDLKSIRAIGDWQRDLPKWGIFIFAPRGDII